MPETVWDLEMPHLFVGNGHFKGAIGLTVIFCFFGTYLITFMTTSIEVQTEALKYVQWLIVSPVLAVAAYTLDGIFFGATATKYMRRAMIESFFLFLASLIVLLPFFENQGIWIAINLLFIFRALTLIRFYPNVEKAIV